MRVTEVGEAKRRWIRNGFLFYKIIWSNLCLLAFKVLYYLRYFTRRLCQTYPWTGWEQTEYDFFSWKDNFKIIQGVPKVRSSNFMRYNFWSKLYFYMKFLKYVPYSIEYLCSEVQLSASPLCFFFITFSSVAVLGEISHVACRAPDDSFWAFLIT